ncbi:transporter substrate-binding domain-containing protein [Shewanella sp. AS16]|uniref:substrate-binding periplasmic protein n=1 Tax=Shewanella sp. AS16 TaxID=2907625 RepID=UPI001F29EA1A|nr:transporter substrate-binding domain-containing protein [Shewanella sp. AS16]MCE9686585.1 transporter substrate-binding domain-containing protein [Shewanella sp. AS16]
MAVAVALLLLGQGALAAPACERPLSVGYDLWPPYAWRDAAGLPQGLDVEMLQGLAEYLGCELQFIYLPAKRSHQMLRSGRLDLMMGASFTPERESYAYFSDSYRGEELKLFVLSQHRHEFQVTSWNDILIQGLSLLVPEAGWYGPAYEENGPRLRQAGLLEYSSNAAASVQMLSYGRADLVLGDAIAMPYIARKNHNLSLYPLALRVGKNEIHLMLSKLGTSPALLTHFNQAIAALKKRGELDAILDKWQPNKPVHLSTH